MLSRNIPNFKSESHVLEKSLSNIEKRIVGYFVVLLSFIADSF